MSIITSIPYPNFIDGVTTVAPATEIRDAGNVCGPLQILRVRSNQDS